MSTNTPIPTTPELLTDNKTIQAAEEAYPDRKIDSAGYYAGSTQLHFHNERLAFIKGAEWQASQQRGEQPSQPQGVSVEAVVEVVKRWTFHISGCENESEWNDPAWQKEVADLRSRLASLLNEQQKG